MELSACKVNGKPFSCAIIKSENETYMVLIDRKGEYAIYQLKGEELIFLWCRDAV